MVTSRQVQEHLDVRHQALTKPETFQNARRAVIESDKADVFALFESRLQVRDEEERCSAIAGLASLYGSEDPEGISRNDGERTALDEPAIQARSASLSFAGHYWASAFGSEVATHRDGDCQNLHCRVVAGQRFAENILGDVDR